MQAPPAGFEIRHQLGQISAIARAKSAPGSVQFQVTEEIDLESHEVVAQVGLPSHEEIQVVRHSRGTHERMLNHHRLIR